MLNSLELNQPQRLSVNNFDDVNIGRISQNDNDVVNLIGREEIELIESAEPPSG